MIFDTLYSRYIFGSNLGRNSESSFVKMNNVYLIGLFKNGGNNGKGALLSYNMTSYNASTLVSFNGTNGAHPTGNLCEATNGKYYGLTSAGGLNNKGVLFEYTGSGISKKVDFNGASSGANPHGSLMEASNGKLYGMTTKGGIYNKGILYEFDPSNGSFTVKHFFNGTIGANPYYTKLVEYDACANATYDTISALVCKQYISPSGKIWTQSGIYSDTLSNQTNCDSIITINLIVSKVDTTVSVSGATLIANFNNGIYQWLDCNTAYSAILGATSQSFQPVVNGNYAVMIMGNGCIDTSYCHQVKNVGIIKNTFESAIHVFPNPTFGLINIDLGKKYPEIELILRNSIGKELKQMKYENRKIIDLNIEGSSGLYLIELHSSEGQKVFIRIVKQ